ncbi:MAG: ArnT family glycosyltransferase [Planctomycetota bacterium JB042]
MSSAETDSLAPGPRSPLATLLLLVAAAVAFQLLRSPYLDVPFTRDEGEYAYIAQRWAAGDVPYRDAFDQKPPLVFLAYRAAFAIGGEEVRSVRVLHGVWVAASALLLFLLVRRAAPTAGPVGAAGAALAFVALVSSHGWFGHVANTEVFMLLPMVASALFLWRADRDDRPRDWVLCGAFAALACWFKPVAGTHVAWVLLFVLAAAWRVGRRGVLVRVTWRWSWLLVGGIVASVPVVLPFALAGVFREFLDAVFLHNVRYAQAVDWSAGAAALERGLAKQAPELAGIWALAAIGIAVRWREARSHVGWLILCAVGAAVGLYFRPHYFMQLGPPLAVLAGLGGVAVIERLARFRVPAVVAALAVAAAIAVPARVVNADLLALDPTGISRRIHDVNPFVEAPSLAERIREGSDPGDTVYVFGSEPEILFHARRKSATRYIITYPLLGGFEDSGERQREAIAEVRAANPRWIVLVSIATSHLEAPDADPYLAVETERIVREGGYVLDSIAVPVDPTGPFKLFTGDRAEPVSNDVLARGGRTPAVRLYRRP